MLRRKVPQEQTSFFERQEVNHSEFAEIIICMKYFFSTLQNDSDKNFIKILLLTW